MNPIRPIVPVLSILLASCGGGIVAGVLAGGSKGKGGAASRVPSLEIAAGQDFAPLRILDLSFLNLPSGSIQQQFKTLTIRDVDAIQGRGGGRPVVILEHKGFGIREKQLTILPSPNKPGARNLLVYFRVDPKPFYAKVESDPRDLLLELSVEIDGRRVGSPIPFHLYRNPMFDRDLLTKRWKRGVLEASVDGSSTVSLPLHRLRARDASDLEVEVYQWDFRAANVTGKIPFRRLVAIGTKMGPSDPKTGVIEVSARIPSARFPGFAFLVVHDLRSGRSDPLPLLYTPELFGVGPAGSALAGGSLAVLIGSGLLPAINQGGKLVYLFDQLKLSLRRGGRKEAVPPKSILQSLSNDRQIVFYMPPSPDGKPGPAALDLELTLTGPQSIKILRSLGPGGGSIPRYGVGQPRLWPLVAPLASGGFDMAKGFFFGSPSGGLPELAILDRVEDFAQVQLMTQAGLGIYRPIGKPVATFGPGFQAARAPLGMLAGDLDTKEGEDLFVIGGAPNQNQILGEHALLSARRNLSSPFQVVLPVLRSPGQILDRARGDIDENGKPDIVLLRAKGAAEAGVEIRFSPFENLKTTTVPLPKGFSARYIDMSDLDGDGHLDLALATEASPWKVLILFGNGTGQFLKSEVHSYDPDKKTLTAGNRAVDLLSFFGASGTRVYRHLLVLVRSDTLGTGGKQWIIPLHFDATKSQFQEASLSSSVLLAAKDRIARGLIDDFAENPGDELLLAATGVREGPLSAWKLGDGKPARITLGVDPSPGMIVPEAMVPVRVGDSDRESQKGIAILHTETFGLEATPVLSVLLKDGKTLASRIPELPIKTEPENLVFGDFDGDGKKGDVVGVVSGSLHRMGRKNGLLFPDSAKVTIPFTGLIASSLSAFPGPDGDRVLWLDGDGSLFWLDAGTVVPKTLGNLRPWLPASWKEARLIEGSKILRADADGDPYPDLVVFLVPDPGAGKTPKRGFLLHLKGRKPSLRTSPVLLPGAGESAGEVLLQGKETPILTADFLGHRAEKQPGLEVAYVFDKSLRFLSLDFDKSGAAVWKIRKILPEVQVGLYPKGLISPDLDEDGRPDLAILLDQERKVRVLVNRILSKGNGVYAGGFSSLPGPDLTFPGITIGFESGDFDGDGLIDICAVSLVQRGVTLSPSVVLFRGRGRATFDTAYVYPEVPYIKTIPQAFGAFDFDGNGMTDLCLGRYPLLSR